MVPEVTGRIVDFPDALSVIVTDFSEGELSAICGPHGKSYLTVTARLGRRLCQQQRDF
jgi:hypothetical protein